MKDDEIEMEKVTLHLEQEPVEKSNNDTDAIESTDKETENVRKRLARNISTCRQLRSMSRNALAEKIGVTEAAIGQYERGIRTPSLGLICKLADTLSVSIDELLAHNAENYDAVKEYRFEQAEKIANGLGYQKINVQGTYDDTNEPMNEFYLYTELNSGNFYRCVDGVFFIDNEVIAKKSDMFAKFKIAMKFKNKETMTLFFEEFAQKVLCAEGVQGVLADVVSTLKTTGKVSIPELFVSYKA